MIFKIIIICCAFFTWSDPHKCTYTNTPHLHACTSTHLTAYTCALTHAHTYTTHTYTYTRTNTRTRTHAHAHKFNILQIHSQIHQISRSILRYTFVQYQKNTFLHDQQAILRVQTFRGR